jgi:putative addiction module CopG family antidote
MAYALAKENEAFNERMIRMGRFNNQSEVVREALRRMEKEENSYLNPPPLSPQQLKEIYKPDTDEERLERLAVKAARRSFQKAAAKVESLEQL